jgi:hypothetical protein
MKKEKLKIKKEKEIKISPEQRIEELIKNLNLAFEEIDERIKNLETYSHTHVVQNYVIH